MNTEFVETLRQIEREKDISFDELVSALEEALAKAFRRTFHEDAEIRLRLDERGRGMQMVRVMRVVDEVEEPGRELTVAAAQRVDPMAQVGQSVEEPLRSESFGRIAATTTRNVLVQGIRDVEQRRLEDSFKEKQGQVLTAVIQRREPRGVYVLINRMEALMPPREQVRSEQYRFNERMKVYVTELRPIGAGKRHQLIVSRAHPNLLVKMLELEVPEIAEGIVEIKGVAREAGMRSKVAVHSNDERVDPIGACVGPRGTRIQSVVNELKGERVDVIPWREKPEEFLTEALSPARPSSVTLRTDPRPGREGEREEKRAYVVVPDSKLSLAIGKEGQNVRLAARLTGWHIDIRSETQHREEEQKERALQERIRAEFEALQSGGAAAAEPVESVEPAKEAGLQESLEGETSGEAPLPVEQSAEAESDTGIEPAGASEAIDCDGGAVDEAGDTVDDSGSHAESLKRTAADPAGEAVHP